MGKSLDLVFSNILEPCFLDTKTIKNRSLSEPKDALKDAEFVYLFSPRHSIPAINKGMIGMCPGSVRRITVESHAIDYMVNLTEIESWEPGKNDFVTFWLKPNRNSKKSKQNTNKINEIQSPLFFIFIFFVRVFLRCIAPTFLVCRRFEVEVDRCALRRRCDEFFTSVVRKSSTATYWRTKGISGDRFFC